MAATTTTIASTGVRDACVGAAAAAGGVTAAEGTDAATLASVASAVVTSVESGFPTGAAAPDVAVVTAAAARSASENSCAVWKRSSARFASALRTTASMAGGNWTLSVEGGSGSSFSTFCMVVV